MDIHDETAEFNPYRTLTKNSNWNLYLPNYMHYFNTIY